VAIPLVVDPIFGASTGHFNKREIASLGDNQYPKGYTL